MCTFLIFQQKARIWQKMENVPHFPLSDRKREMCYIQLSAQNRLTWIDSAILLSRMAQMGTCNLNCKCQGWACLAVKNWGGADLLRREMRFHPSTFSTLWWPSPIPHPPTIKVRRKRTSETPSTCGTWSWLFYWASLVGGIALRPCNWPLKVHLGFSSTRRFWGACTLCVPANSRRNKLFCSQPRGPGLGFNCKTRGEGSPKVQNTRVWKIWFLFGKRELQNFGPIRFFLLSS
jgi:hypothetical protein